MLNFMSLFLLFAILLHFSHSSTITDNIQYNRRPDVILQGDIAKKNNKNSNIVDDWWTKWPNGTIPYTINNNIPPAFRTVIEQSMSLIQTQTKNCIKFVSIKPNSPNLPSTWLHVLPDVGCWSWIGQGKGEQWLVLSNGCWYQDIVVHELLHTIGFWHEQSRPDRDEYVEINWSNIAPEYIAEFEKRGDAIDTMGTPYDYNSIMHYRYNTFATDSSKPTMIPKDKNVDMYAIGTRNDLSPLDIEKIWMYYGCKYN